MTKVLTPTAEFWKRVQALADRPYYPPPRL
jgi:hypothetical protein